MDTNRSKNKNITNKILEENRTTDFRLQSRTNYWKRMTAENTTSNR